MARHDLGMLNVAYATLNSAQKLLHRGAVGNDVNLIRDALHSDPGIINSNLGGGTHYVGFRAIHWAAANGNLAVIRELKQHNVDLTQRTGAGWVQHFWQEKCEFALEVAAYHLWDARHLQRGEILRELRLEPQNIASREELLYLGAITNDITYLEAALERRVNVNQNLGNYKDTGFTALHWAAKYDNREAMQWLIRNGADQTIRTGGGLTYEQVLEEYKAPGQRLSPVGFGTAHLCNTIGLWGYGKRDYGRIGKNTSQTIAKTADHISNLKNVYQALPEEAKKCIPESLRNIVEKLPSVPPVLIDKSCKEETITYRH